MDSSNAMHMAYLQQLTSSALGGYPNYGHWSGSGKVTLRTGPIYNSERIKAGSIDIVRNKSAYVYITAQTVTSKKLILLTGAMASGAFKATTISSYGGAESRIHSGTKYLHFVHVDTSGNLRYSCMLPPSP